jgi:hypothetical protein
LAGGTGHGCVGCSCAAMISEADGSASESPFVAWAGALLDVESIRLGRFQGWRPGPPFTASASLGPQLFGRLLV